MKKIPVLLAALFLYAVCLTACKKADNPERNTEENRVENTAEAGRQFIRKVTEEAIQLESLEEELLAGQMLEEQKELYDCYIEKLEKLLSENGGQEEGKIYQEYINSIYIYSSAYAGGLQAEANTDGTMAFWMVMENGDSEERQSFHCRLLADGSLWFTCQMESESEKELPSYIVNEDVLRYSRADYVYDDGETDIEEKKQLRRQALEQYMEEEIRGEVQEFWCSGDWVYKIDRENGIFADVTEGREGCIADFLREQPKRIRCQLEVSEASLEEVEKYKPEGYCLLWEQNAWRRIGVCDLNHDGKMDYVAVLYPEDYEEVRRYAEACPYENTPQYYASGFWLLLSSETEGYEQIQLSDSIEYWEGALDLIEVGFVAEGILQLEYFVGRSPFSNAQLRFQYDEEKKNFYMLRSYYRDSYDDAMLIGDTDNYGETKMYSYFARQQHYCEGVWDSVGNIPMQDGNMLGYYSDSFQYRCENLLEERRINSLIWEKEYELFLALKQYYPQMELEFHMVADPVFYNRKLVSGQMELYGHAGDDIEFGTDMPIMVDKQSGEYVTVTGLLEKEEFTQIFDDWFEDAFSSGRMTAEEKTWCEEAIGRCWEKADLVENYLAPKEEILFLQIVQNGIRIGVQPETSKWMKYYIIDKEYFIGTKVWEYLAPYF